MSVGLYTHEDMFDHRPGEGHAERPERLRAVLDALAEADDLDLEVREAPRAEIGDLQRVHPAAYVERILAATPGAGLTALDPDTRLSAGSVNAARRAAGGVVAAVQAVAAGRMQRAFCAVRPPGHHAKPDRAMGFCVFSSVAVGARAARHAGLKRVAVVDFDVHHGNGTQAAVQDDASLFFASVHQSPLYPGTGAAEETGVGNVVNAPVRPMAPAGVWRRAFESLMPPLEAFRPDLILVSAGFDAHARDPLAHQALEEADFAWATRAVLEVARRVCDGRVVSSLEGGYDLQALGRSAAAHVRALQAG